MSETNLRDGACTASCCSFFLLCVVFILARWAFRKLYPRLYLLARTFFMYSYCIGKEQKCAVEWGEREMWKVFSVVVVCLLRLWKNNIEWVFFSLCWWLHLYLSCSVFSAIRLCVAWRWNENGELKVFLLHYLFYDEVKIYSSIRNLHHRWAWLEHSSISFRLCNWDSRSPRNWYAKEVHRPRACQIIDTNIWMCTRTATITFRFL